MNELQKFKRELDDMAYGTNVIFVALLTKSSTMCKEFVFDHYQEHDNKFYIYSEDNEEIAIDMSQVKIVEDDQHYTFVSAESEVIVDFLSPCIGNNISLLAFCADNKNA